jgi:glycosyltransferase involved in cell wall biosynthesis
VRLDIVIPAHNEEARIGRTLDAYLERLTDPELRFIVALDACTDDTAAVVGERMRRDGRVELLPLPKLGKGGVIREAFARSDADLVGFVDADGATPPRELIRLAEAAQAPRADGAIASRRHPAAVLPVSRPLSRRVVSTGFAVGVRTLLGLPYADTQCGAKVLTRECVERIMPHVSVSDLSFDVDLLLAARRHGQRIVELPTVWIDRAGSRVSAVRDTRKMGTSLFSLWRRERAFAS